MYRLSQHLPEGPVRRPAVFTRGGSQGAPGSAWARCFYWNQGPRDPPGPEPEASIAISRLRLTRPAKPATAAGEKTERIPGSGFLPARSAPSRNAFLPRNFWPLRRPSNAIMHDRPPVLRGLRNGHMFPFDTLVDLSQPGDGMSETQNQLSLTRVAPIIGAPTKTRTPLN